MKDYNKNWRLNIDKKQKKNELDWRIHLHYEYVQFVEEAEKLAELYDWDFWGGGVGIYAVTLSQPIRDGKEISIRLISSSNYGYCVSFAKEGNPNNISISEYHECIASTLEEALKYLHSFLIENKYHREIKSDRTVVKGGAYDRFKHALIWAYEAIEDNCAIDSTKTVS